MNTWKMMMRFIETSFLFSGWEENRGSFKVQTEYLGFLII